eukprot:COSAG02_NODE_7450_length_3008_cov_1.793056_3_plen_88_part_00
MIDRLRRQSLSHCHELGQRRHLSRTRRHSPVWISDSISLAELPRLPGDVHIPQCRFSGLEGTSIRVVFIPSTLLCQSTQDLLQYFAC